jgi:hypothetical protein
VNPDQPHLDLAGLRDLCRARSEPPIPNVKLHNEALTNEIIASYTIDVHQFVYELVQTTVGRIGRQKVDGRRRSEVVHLEDGRTSHVPFEQQTLFQAEQTARRKIRNGEASIAEGMADLAVINAATIAAARTALSLTDTRIKDVFSAREIAELRGETEDVAA